MYVGGLLHRLIKDNCYKMLEDSLRALDWFESDRGHLPVQLLPEELPESDPVEPNIVCVTFDGFDEEEAEMGSNLAYHRSDLYVDIYAESEAVAMHLTGDIKDILAGRFSTIGRYRPTFDVLDLTQENPSFLFSCDIEDISSAHSRTSRRLIEKHYWVVSATVSYAYGDEDGDY